MTPEHGTVHRGRVYDAETRRWYRDGFAPFQLPEFLRATCGRCGGELFVFKGGAAICRRCSYGEADDDRR